MQTPRPSSVLCVSLLYARSCFGPVTGDPKNMSATSWRRKVGQCRLRHFEPRRLAIPCARVTQPLPAWADARYVYARRNPAIEVRRRMYVVVSMLSRIGLLAASRLDSTRQVPLCQKTRMHDGTEAMVSRVDVLVMIAATGPRSSSRYPSQPRA